MTTCVWIDFSTKSNKWSLNRQACWMNGVFRVGNYELLPQIILTRPLLWGSLRNRYTWQIRTRDIKCRPGSENTPDIRWRSNNSRCIATSSLTAMHTDSSNTGTQKISLWILTSVYCGTTYECAVTDFWHLTV